MIQDRARELLRSGDPAQALAALQEQVRGDPSNAEKRVFLFQLLSVMGQWGRAATQLEVAAELDAKTLAMAQMYREALRCEALRADVFAGKKSPLIFGEPEEWLALLIEALLVQGHNGHAAKSDELRAQALELAPASAGTVNGEPFAWIADADSRLGPVCEAIINGRYYWVPFARLSQVDVEAPSDLRDVAWTPAHFEFVNGGDVVGIIPSRYTGSEGADASLCLARKTTWQEVRPGVFEGLGQRILATDAGEYPLFEVRSIVFDAPGAAGSGDG